MNAAMTERVNCERLKVDVELHRFIEQEALPGTGIEATTFWKGVDALIHDLGPRNRELLAERDRLQQELDDLFTGYLFLPELSVKAKPCTHQLLEG